MRIPLTTTPGLVVVVELLGVVKPAQLPEAFPSSDTVGVGRLKAEVSIAEAEKRVRTVSLQDQLATCRWNAHFPLLHRENPCHSFPLPLFKGKQSQKGGSLKYPISRATSPSSLDLPIAPSLTAAGRLLLTPRAHSWPWPSGGARPLSPTLVAQRTPTSPLVHRPSAERGAWRLGAADGEGWQLVGDGS